MLVRPAAQAGIEVFMLRRSEASHFVPDVYVFPGGTVDQGDLSEEALERACGVEQERIAEQFRAENEPSFPAPQGSPPPREAAGLLIAAVRELFEEAGVLLASTRDGVPLADADLAPYRDRLHAARGLVHAGQLPFAELLEEIDAYANARALTLFSHWITPPKFSRRYNAHFFLASALPDQAATADTIETHDGVWIAPREALERTRTGTFRMVYPTIKHVERLAQFDDVDALTAFAQLKRIISIMPDTPAEREFSMPASLEYAW
jgi:8-oxo-dGTP pyrophosphatase MutT (NUDIX family)